MTSPDHDPTGTDGRTDAAGDVGPTVGSSATPDRRVTLAIVLSIIAIVMSGLVLVRLVIDGTGPSPARVTVPDLVGLSFADARIVATAIGVELVPAGRTSDQPISTVLSQEPAPGAMVERGSRILVTIATAADLVIVPDLRGVPEANAPGLLRDAGLTMGVRTETSDPSVAAGSISGQDPSAGAEVPRGTPVSYEVSVAPLPTSTIGPSPSPSPSPTPDATAMPPTGGSIVVGDYRCLTLREAAVRIERDELSLGTVSYSIEGGPVDDTWIVERQTPQAGATRPPRAGVNLLLASPFSTCLEGQSS
jgi:hypothetical protein